MLKIKTKGLFIILTLFFLFLFALPAFGGEPDYTSESTVSEGGIVTCSGFDCTLDDLFALPGRVIDFVLFNIIPPLAIFGFIWAGIIMMTSQGDPAKFKQGKTAIIAIAVGLIIIYLSWALVKLFIETLGGKSWVTEFFSE